MAGNVLNNAVRLVELVAPQVLGALCCSLNTLYLWAFGFSVSIGQLYQDHVYQFMFLGHRNLGLLIIVPVVFLVSCIGEILATGRPSMKLGGFLLAVSIAIYCPACYLSVLRGLNSRGEVGGNRTIVWWVHVVTPILAVWVRLPPYGAKVAETVSG